MERVGRTERRTELQEEESQSRWNAVRGKSGLNILDEHNAAVNALPKSIKGEDAAVKEQEARRQLKALCVDIMAARRTVEATRNNKSGLAKSTVNADLLQTVKQDMAKSKTPS